MNTANLSELLQGQVFHALIVLAVAIYALNAILLAVEAGYDLWGRFVLGCLQGLGGGTIRDFLIGGNRMPPFYTRDPAFILAIFSVVVVVSILSATKADFHQTPAFQSVKKYADICGFALLATVGACIGLAAGLAWFWIPIVAALSCAGGGALRDITIMKAPTSFRGVIFEEVAAFGGLVLLGALTIDEHFFSNSLSLAIAVGFTVATIIALRVTILAYNIQYPQWLLYKTRQRHEAKAPLDAALGETLPQLRSFLTHCGVTWSVPRQILADASSSLEECLILLQTHRRGNPHHVSATFDSHKFVLHLSHNGQPLALDFDPDKHWHDTETPELELTLRVLEHYTTSITTQQGKDGAEIVMMFEERIEETIKV